MAVKPIDPVSDERVTHETALVNGQQYHYILGVPKDGNYRATVFLVHGWPDISAGWRYQIPVLLDLGCRIVAMDMMGYGRTDAPKVPPAPVSLYGFKRASDDIAELARQLGAKQIILGGHDWGGMVVWRCAGWHPELISHLFAVCTPYAAPSSTYVSTEDLVNGPVPQFGYQLHLASGEVEKVINSKESIRQFLQGMYGGRGPNGETTFSPEKGVLFDNLPKVGKTELLSDRELEYYADEYSRTGLHGPLNWYKTRKVNFEEERHLHKRTIDIPTLFIQASRDTVLKPEMAAGMDKLVTKLTRREVVAAHWALWEKPEECNAHIREWFENVVFGRESKL